MSRPLLAAERHASTGWFRRTGKADYSQHEHMHTHTCTYRYINTHARTHTHVHMHTNTVKLVKLEMREMATVKVK